MFVIFLIPIILILLFRFLFFKGRFRPFHKSGDFVFSLYLISMILGVIFYILYPDDVSVYNPSIAAMIYLSVALIIYLFPLLYFQDKKSYRLDIIDKSFFKILCLFFLIGSVYAMFIFIPKAIYAFSSGIESNRLMLNAGDFKVFEGSFLETIAVGFSAFFSFVQILALIVISFKIFGKKSNIIGGFMLISSSSYIFNVFAYAGRDGVVFWFFSLLFNYVMLKLWFGIEVSKSISKLIWLSLFLFSLLFMYITFSRFSSEVVLSMLSYFSQQITNFNDLFVLNPPLYYGSANFFQLKSYMFSDTLEWGDLHYYYLSNNVYPWVFSFFIGSFLIDFGKSVTLIILFLFSFFMFFSLIKKTKSSRKLINIYHVLLFSFYGQIGYMGLFYFKHGSLNNYILSLFFISLFLYLFKLISKRSFVLSIKSES